MQENYKQNDNTVVFKHLITMIHCFRNKPKKNANFFSLFSINECVYWECHDHFHNIDHVAAANVDKFIQLECTTLQTAFF